MVISVVIPTLNEEDYVEGCLHQFLPFKKKYDIELIVSDGGSRDKTLSIARKHADKVIECTPDEEQNIAMGRNNGCRVAQGDIIFCTDADVRIPDPESFFRDVIELFSDNDLVGITTYLKYIHDETRMIDRFMDPIINAVVRCSWFIGLGLARGETHIMRHSAYDQVGGYDESIVVGEDHLFFRKLKKIGKTAFVPDLTILHSTRRYRKYGYIRTILQWTVDGIYIALFGKAYHKKWSDPK